MKILMLCLVTVLLSGWADGQTSLAPLPPAIIALLDQKFPAYPAEGFPGGRVADVSARELQWLKNNGFNAAHPAFVTGDFDGNGKEDYAVLVWYGTDQIGKQIFPNAFVVALLGQDSGYNLMELNPGGCGECYKFLTVGRKGETRYVWQTGKRFVYQRDSLEGWGFDNGVGRAFTNLANETEWGIEISRFPDSDTVLAQFSATTPQVRPADYRGKSATGIVTSNDEAEGLHLNAHRYTVVARLKPGMTVKLKDGITRELKLSDIPRGKLITIYYTEKESTDAQGNRINEIFWIKFPAAGK